MHLAGIRVLWRQSDTMALYGIPYDMRPGQQPADLTRGSPTLPPGTYGAKPRAPGPRDDWLYLGSPGWWGSLSRGDQSAIVAWLATLEPGIVPTGPNEWSPVRPEVQRVEPEDPVPVEEARSQRPPPRPRLRAWPQTP